MPDSDTGERVTNVFNQPSRDGLVVNAVRVDYEPSGFSRVHNGRTEGGVMRVVRLRAAGGPEQLAVAEADKPRPGPEEALVRVRAAAITRGELEWPVDRLPAIPSYELSGVVEEVGPGVSGVAPGDEVFALTPFDRDGVAADYTAVPSEVLVPRPRALSHAESAAIPLPALTAWQGLFDHDRLGAGERVLIHGAAGGVGGFAVQLARAAGAHVIGTASAETLGFVL